MFKKFSYLASVSLLATTVLTPGVYGMDIPENKGVKNVSTRKISSFQDHNGVLEVIKEFYNPTAPLLLTNEVHEDKAEQEVSTAWWLLSNVGSLAYTVGSTVIVKPTGNLLRWTGDKIRDDSFVGDLLVDNAIAMGKDVNIVGNMAANLTGKIENNEGVMQSIRSTTGNILRGTGEMFVGQTPTLPRAIRKFWIDNKYSEKPEEAFTCTACALYLSPYINGVDHITQSYNDFLNSWNGSSYTQHSLNPAINQECFIRGITRAYVIRQLPVDDKFTQQVLTLGCNLEILPATQLITRESVMKIKPNLQANELDKEVKVEREAKFLEYAKGVYEFENRKNLANMERQKIVMNKPLVITEPVKNEEPAKTLTTDLGLSMIEYHPIATLNISKNPQEDENNQANFDLDVD